ncbi:MAG TPA: VOC family protein [Polyangiaceae bacterium]|nr:VOC family protein [Polyangiaceae bacterium]
MKPLKNPSQLFPMFITPKLAETKAFYLAAGFKVRFDLPQYLQVYYDGGLDLCFMLPDAPSNGKQYGAFGGQGVVVSIPTRNADEKAVELRERRLPIVSEVEDKPWGWRSFHAVDPNGVILDFFHVYKEIDTPAPNEQS